jgi:hypothetical protein
VSKQHHKRRRNITTPPTGILEKDYSSDAEKSIKIPGYENTRPSFGSKKITNFSSLSLIIFKIDGFPAKY